MRLFYRALLMVLLLSLFTMTRAQSELPKKQIDLKITGVSGKVLENVQSRLDVKKNVIYTRQPDIIKWRYYLEIPAEVKAALAPFGYFRPKVKTHLTKTADLWQITVSVVPGRRLKFTKVSVLVTGAGKEDKAFKNYLSHLPIQTGDNFNSAKYEKTKDTLQDIANARGYFKAQLQKNQLTVDLDNNTSEAIIVFDTGPRYHFGETHFSPTPFKTSFLMHYLTYQPGQYYSSYKLEKSRTNLSSSNYFQQVVTTPEINAAKDLMVPIKTTLSMQDQVLYSFGAGYGDVTGPRALASMDLRWLNASGHSLHFLLRGAEFNSTAVVTYVIPGHKPAHEYYTIDTGYSELRQVSGRGSNFHTAVTYQNMFGGWRFSAGLTYLIEKYDLLNFPIQNTNTNTNAQMLYPRITLQKTYAKKDILNPDYGYNIAFTAAAGARNFGSKTSFSQFRLDTKFLYTLPTHTRVLPRLSLGYTTISNLTNLPLSMQFYAGGFPTVRGFLFNQIGPGRVLAIGSFELQQRIYGKFYLAGFIDAGMVTDTNTASSGIPTIPLRKHRLNVGSGPALVYLSPIGSIEVSFANVLNAANSSTNPFINRIGQWVVQFGLGVLL